MSLLELAQRQTDLLVQDEIKKDVDNVGGLAEIKDLEAPRKSINYAPHELLAEGSRLHTSIADVIHHSRLLHGDGQAEQLLIELNSAAQINRGPDGVFESSRLHWDMLLGRDSEMHPSDYLNFDAKMKL
ncbi:unnamed protein product [Auanema sp. JU1783]|nr:unnamed protein product [Auanema sp. JU1783]